MTGDIERVSSPTVSGSEWNAIERQAAALAQSDIIPQAYRRKPANIIVAAVTGRHFGWDVLTAMRNGHVIENQWAMKPEAMLGLVRQAGHSVTSEMTPDGATVIGKRNDNGDTMTVTFTIEDAVRAGLCGMKDGKPHARTSSGKRLPWEQYPQMMCYWRAIGMLCRLLFSDLTAGVHSTEELGGGDFDEPIEAVSIEPLPLSADALAAFEKACADHGLTPADVMSQAFNDEVPNPLLDSHLPAMRDAFKALVQEMGDADITDAEVVEDDEVQHPAHEVRPATRGMVGKVKGEYARLGVVDRIEQLAETEKAIGRRIASHNELTMDEASKLLDELGSIPTPELVE